MDGALKFAELFPRNSDPRYGLEREADRIGKGGDRRTDSGIKKRPRDDIELRESNTGFYNR